MLRRGTGLFPATSCAQELQAFLAEAAERVRKVFHGPLTYASTMFEVVDWSLFDYIGIDHYRNSKVEHRYAERIGPYLGQGKPVINTEFGHSSYRGDRQPARIDYPAEVKRWRVFADQARHMAEPREQPP